MTQNFGAEATKGACGIRAQPMPQVKNFTVIKPIGGGGFGRVYLAHDLTGNPCALKVVNRSDVDENYAYDREYASVCSYMPLRGKNPNLIEILYFGKEDDFFYYTMPAADDVQGRPYDPATYEPKTLRSLMPEKGKAMPIKKAIAAVLPILDALEFLHSAVPQRLHRDVKPDNIVYIDGKPVLGDIGIMTEPKPDMTHVLTHGYGPDGGVVDAAGDLYSVGMVLFEASGGDIKRGYVYLPTIQCDRPAPLFQMLSSVIDNAHALRYTSARAMKKDMENILNGGSANARSTAPLRTPASRDSPQKLLPMRAGGDASAGIRANAQTVRRPRATSKTRKGAEIIITVPVPEIVTDTYNAAAGAVAAAGDAIRQNLPVALETAAASADYAKDVVLYEGWRAQKGVAKATKKMGRKASKTGSQLKKSALRTLKKIGRMLPSGW